MNTSTLASVLALSLITVACGGVEPIDATDMPDAGVEAPDAPEQPGPDAPPAPVAGTQDTAYGTDGAVLLDAVPGYPADAAVQGDKLIVCSTHSENGVLRAKLTRVGFDGAVDTTFGLDGEGHFPGIDGTSCRRIAVRPDGSIVAYVVQPGILGALLRFDRDGTTVDSEIAASSLRGMNLAGNMLLSAQSLAPSTQVASDAEHPADMAANESLTGTPLKPFSIGGKHALVGTFTKGASTGWGVARETGEGTLAAPAEVVTAGTATQDFLLDAAALADGSILAVGSADQDRDSMLALFPPTGAATVKTQHLGLTSSSRRVILDGAGRPIVLGSATEGGASKLTWQRLGTDLAPDPTYAGGGTVTAPAPHGSGDIAGAVRYGGSIYILASYDVEQPTPKTALIKIAE
jgi:hypothetical protein